MLWLKSLHIISMVAWFSGLFYLPRLFVYHADAKDEISNERFKIMEKKLYKLIMNPAAIATLAFGLLMIVQFPAYLKMGWLHIKITLVIFLLGYHHYCARIIKQFANNSNNKSNKFYRYLNEIPTVFLILIVILAVVKPF